MSASKQSRGSFALVTHTLGRSGNYAMRDNIFQNRWGEPVEVFGQRVEAGQLVHADKHGFIAIPKGC